MSSARVAFPPVVYVPTSAADAQGQARLELVELADGRRALFAYSAMDRLMDMYRSDAPWVLLTVAELERAHQEVPYDLLLLDRVVNLPGPDGTSTPGDAE